MATGQKSFTMRAFHFTSPVGYVYWNSGSLPDLAATYAPYSAGTLSDIIILSSGSANLLELRASADAGSLALPTLTVIDQVYASCPMMLLPNGLSSQAGQIGFSGSGSVICDINQNGTTVATVQFNDVGGPNFTTVGGLPVSILVGDKIELVTPVDTKGLTSVQVTLFGA